jgi:hypothetical protein
MTKLTVAFQNFANAPNNGMSNLKKKGNYSHKLLFLTGLCNGSSGVLCEEETEFLNIIQTNFRSSKGLCHISGSACSSSHCEAQLHSLARRSEICRTQKWHWDRVFTKYLGLLISLSLNHRS